MTRNYILVFALFIIVTNLLRANTDRVRSGIIITKSVDEETHSPDTLPRKMDRSGASAQQKEMHRQMAEANKAILELEKSDPEAAKMAKRMMGQIQEKKEQPVLPDAPLPKMSSPIVTIPLKAIPRTPTAAEATDLLLGYKGKKIDANTLITTNGNVVFFNKAKHQLVMKPNPKSDPFDKMVKEVLQTEKRKRELVDQLNKTKNGSFLYPAMVKSLQQFDALGKSYAGILKNTIDVPPPPPVIPDPSAQATEKNDPKKGKVIPAAVITAYKEVLEMIKNAPSLDFAAPVTKEYDICFSCDSNAQKAYEAEKENWKTEFFAFEKSLQTKTLGAAMMLDGLGAGYNEEEVAEMNARLTAANAFNLSRREKKAEILVEKYSKDFKMYPVIIETLMGIERQKQLADNQDNSFEETINKVAGLQTSFENYIKEQIKELNYNVVMNVQNILAMERQKQILGLEESGKMQFINQLEAFNRFNLSLHIEFKMHTIDADGKEGPFFATGTLQSQGNVFVSLGWKDCKYMLYLTNTDYRTAKEKDFRIPMFITEGEKSIQREEKPYDWYVVKYSGPQNIYEVFPSNAISFCEGDKDSLFFSVPTYAEDIERYASSIRKQYTIDFLGYLMGMMVNEEGLKNKQGDLEQIGRHMMKIHTEGKPITPTGYGPQDRQQAEHLKNLALTNQESNLSSLGMVGKMLLVFDTHNRSPVLIDETFDVAHMNTKGTVHLKIVHAPGN